MNMQNGWESAKRRSEIISSGLALEIANWLMGQLRAGAKWVAHESLYKPDLCLSRLEAIMASDADCDEEAAKIRKVIVSHFDFQFWKAVIKPMFYEYRRGSNVIRLSEGVYQELKQYAAERDLDSLDAAVDQLLLDNFTRGRTENT